MRLLVTGGAGFVGSALVRRAVGRGHEVHAIIRGGDGGLPPGVTAHRANLLTEHIGPVLARIRPTHLVHLAWVTDPATYWTSAENARWVQASIALLASFAEQGGRRAILTGSCAEYDWTAGGPLSEELTALRPATPYGRAKDDLRRTAENRPHLRDIDLVWARLFFLYGPGEHPDRLVPYVTRRLIAGEPALCSAGTQRRDFLFVEDAAEALLHLAESAISGPVNVGSGQATAVGKVIDGIAQRLGRTDLVRLGARESQEGEPELLVADTTRLTSDGWRPRHPLAEGLAKTVDWWKEREGHPGD